MTQGPRELSTGPNEAATDEPIAGTAPVIPDEALGPGEDLPAPQSNEQVERTTRALNAPLAGKSDDPLPLKGE